MKKVLALTVVVLRFAAYANPAVADEPAIIEYFKVKSPVNVGEKVITWFVVQDDSSKTYGASIGFEPLHSTGDIFTVGDTASLNWVYQRPDTFQLTLLVLDEGLNFTDSTLTLIVQGLPTSLDDDDGIVPTEFELSQNYPNPFNPSTTISYALPSVSRVTLTIYDVLGRVVATLVDGEQPAGRHNVVWEPKDLASGVYIYRLQAKNFAETKKLTLIK